MEGKGGIQLPGPTDVSWLGMVSRVLNQRAFGQRSWADAQRWGSPACAGARSGLAQVGDSDGVGRRLRRMLDGMSGEAHAQRTRNLQNGVEARLRARRECLVQALATEPRIFGNLRHAARASDIAEGQEKKIRILRLEYGIHVLDDCFIVGKVLCDVKRY
jgi:hypothetical protein